MCVLVCVCVCPDVLTFNAAVARLQVRLQFLQTRMRGFELSVRNAQFANALAGTATVGHVKDVLRAADVSHVDLDAAAETHPTVARLLQDDHLALGAFGTEHLRVAVLIAQLCTNDRQTDIGGRNRRGNPDWVITLYGVVSACFIRRNATHCISPYAIVMSSIIRPPTPDWTRSLKMIKVNKLNFRRNATPYAIVVCVCVCVCVNAAFEDARKTV